MDYSLKLLEFLVSRPPFAEALSMPRFFIPPKEDENRLIRDYLCVENNRHFRIHKGFYSNARDDHQHG